MSPRLVLLVALVLTGGGQVANREPWRGFAFLMFALLLGAVTAATAAPDASAVGRLSGGIFVHLMAAFDAYKRAMLRRARQGRAARSPAA